MQHRPESTATVTTTGLENLLGLSNSDEAGSHSLASSVSVYLSAVFFFIILLSFFATVTFGSQLTLALYARSARSLDVEKQQQHTHAWKRIKAIFQPKSSNVKKPQLPAYEHAVRQAVLKHGTRPGDVYSEFHAITVEEMELERIRKLGGAPPGKIGQFLSILSCPKTTDS